MMTMIAIDTRASIELGPNNSYNPTAPRRDGEFQPPHGRKMAQPRLPFVYCRNTPPQIFGDNSSERQEEWTRVPWRFSR